MQIPVSKYDYGYLRFGGADWYGGGMAQYYGPPLSMWYNLWPLIVTILLGMTVGALAFVQGG